MFLNTHIHVFFIVCSLEATFVPRCNKITSLLLSFCKRCNHLLFYRTRLGCRISLQHDFCTLRCFQLIYIYLQNDSTELLARVPRVARSGCLFITKDLLGISHTSLTSRTREGSLIVRMIYSALYLHCVFAARLIM